MKAEGPCVINTQKIDDCSGIHFLQMADNPTQAILAIKVVYWLAQLIKSGFSLMQRYQCYQQNQILFISNLVLFSLLYLSILT